MTKGENMLKGLIAFDTRAAVKLNGNRIGALNDYGAQRQPVKAHVNEMKNRIGALNDFDAQRQPVKRTYPIPYTILRMRSVN